MTLTRILVTLMLAGITGKAASQDQGTTAVVQPKPQQSPSPSPAEKMMPLVAPLYIENGELSSMVTVINPTGAAFTADIVLKDQQGIKLRKRAFN